MPTTLNANPIFASMSNMIISQQTFADNFSHKYDLVDRARVDGSLYGDMKRYVSVDVLGVATWGNDSEAGNLLTLHRPKDPNVQTIQLDKAKQICLTIDYYLTKQAWMGEGSFMEFTSVMLGMLGETKRVFDVTTYNTFIGTDTGDLINSPKQDISIDVTTATTGLSGEEAARVKSQTIAQGIADLLVELSDYTRDYTDEKNLRSYDESEIKFVWNASYINEITNLDLPTIFHNEELKKHFGDIKLPSRYFGEIQGSSGTANGTSDRYLEAPDSVNTGTIKFAGDLIPSGTALSGNDYYRADPKIICKVFVKLPPIMSAFKVGTSFFNPKSLTETHYLTWMYNTLQHLTNYPCITIREI